MAAAENPLPLVVPATRCQDSRGLVLKHAANEFVFAVVGHVGSGTSEIAESLRESLSEKTLPGGAFEVRILKARDVITNWAREKGEPLPDGGDGEHEDTIAAANTQAKERLEPGNLGENAIHDLRHWL